MAAKTNSDKLALGDKAYVMPEIGKIVRISEVKELDGETVIAKTLVTIQYENGQKQFNMDLLAKAEDK